MVAENGQSEAHNESFGDLIPDKRSEGAGCVGVDSNGLAILDVEHRKRRGAAQGAGWLSRAGYGSDEQATQ